MSEPSMNGGEAVVKTLQRAGVDTTFGINGAHVDTIYQAAKDRGLRIVDTRHEVSAGHAAEGYARATGRLGVALVTAGGGLTNVVTSITNAYQDRTPVLYIAGSGPLELDQTNDLQAGIDQVAITTPVTKWAHRITRADLIPRILAQAIRIATTAPCGPVLLDIPWDVLRNEVGDPTPYRLYADAAGAPSGPVTERIIEAIVKSERPVVLVGDRAIGHRAAAELHQLAAALDLPLFADYDGLGAVLRSDHGVGLLQMLTTLPAAERPDLVLMLGLRFGLLTALGSGTIVPRAAKIIQIDADARELGRLQDVDLAIAADPAEAVRALAAAARTETQGVERSAWRQLLRDTARTRQRMVAAEAVRDSRVHPFDAVEAIADAVPEGAVIVCDGALTYLWLSETIASARPDVYLSHGYLGSMGIGMGTALGAAAVRPDVPVLLVTGDGAVGYGLGEFDTMVRAKIPVVVVVLNNRAWGATLHAQEIVLGVDRITNNRLENGSYSAVARALGADGYDVDALPDLRETIRTALDAGRPACIDVQVSLDPIPPEERVLMGQLPFGLPREA